MTFVSRPGGLPFESQILQIGAFCVRNAASFESEDPLTVLLDSGQPLPELDRWPKRLQDLVSVMSDLNRRICRMSTKQAADDAAERAFLIAHYVGGRMVYLPRGDVLAKAIQDALSFQMAKSCPASEVANALGLTEAMVRTALERQSAIQAGQHKGRLFDQADEHDAGQQ